MEGWIFIRDGYCLLQHAVENILYLTMPLQYRTSGSIVSWFCSIVAQQREMKTTATLLKKVNRLTWSSKEMGSKQESPLRNPEAWRLVGILEILNQSLKPCQQRTIAAYSS